MFIFVIQSPLLSPVAFFAQPLARFFIKCVFFGKWVTTPTLISEASSAINASGYRLKVKRITARPCVAQVVKLESFRNDVAKECKSESMHSNVFPIVSGIPVASVVSIKLSQPEPTTRIGFDENSLSHTLRKSVKINRHHKRPYSSMFWLLWGFLLKMVT